MKKATILAIETSCDETSVAIVKDGRKIITNIISSQIDTHKQFGGVVPELASRLHLEQMNYILAHAISDSNLHWEDIDAISVTKGPGLIGALLVGVSCAKALSFCLNKPLIGVNHMEGHICANFISHHELEPPFSSLVVSGGHTYIVDVTDYGKYQIVGRTKDDAAGEAFDKVARALGLSYPGGPEIDQRAKLGNKDAIDFPRVMINSGDYNFSFSGLKTAVLNYLNHEKQHGRKIVIEDVAASFQAAALEVLVHKITQFTEERGYDRLTVSGGVSANKQLRSILHQQGRKKNWNIYFPEPELCTDNAAMIASAAYYNFIRGNTDNLSMKVYPNLEL